MYEERDEQRQAQVSAVLGEVASDQVVAEVREKARHDQLVRGRHDRAEEVGPDALERTDRDHRPPQVIGTAHHLVDRVTGQQDKDGDGEEAGIADVGPARRNEVSVADGEPAHGDEHEQQARAQDVR